VRFFSTGTCHPIDSQSEILRKNVSGGGGKPSLGQKQITLTGDDPKVVQIQCAPPWLKLAAFYSIKQISRGSRKKTQQAIVIHPIKEQRELMYFDLTASHDGSTN